MLQPKPASALTIPTFKDLVEIYGPYLGLILFLVIAYLVMQYIWFAKVVKAKDMEIDRLVEHEKELNNRLMHIIDREIGYNQKVPPAQ